jgi:peptidoglycan/xylan/chitin deacetylase (PgdA/CDA1 family)
VLIYHRIAPRDAPRYEAVRTIPRGLFREQLNAFGELGRIVPLQALLDDPDDEQQPLRLALTFDDDYVSHAREVLPILRDLDLHGTFFLSGRALHGLGGYWFQRLEALIAERGLSATTELLELPGAVEPQLPLRCEGDPRRLALIDRHAPAGEPPLDGAGIRDLAAAGMTIGFHTLHHPVLPQLEYEALREALTEGRDRLAAVVGQPLRWFAYPHGKADGRTLTLTREAGYTAAWTTQPRLLRASDDPHQLGRWEPQPLATDDVLILIGRLLRRPPTWVDSPPRSVGRRRPPLYHRCPNDP